MGRTEINILAVSILALSCFFKQLTDKCSLPFKGGCVLGDQFPQVAMFAIKYLKVSNVFGHVIPNEVLNVNYNSFWCQLWFKINHFSHNACSSDASLCLYSKKETALQKDNPNLPKSAVNSTLYCT